MRKTRVLLPILTVGMLGFLVVGPGLTFQNEPEGFRGLKWGDPPGKDMVYYGKSKDNENVLWYKRKNDKLQIGRARIKCIHYLFYKGQFMEVLIKTGEVEDYVSLKEVVELKFGEERCHTAKIYNKWCGDIATVILQKTISSWDEFLSDTGQGILEICSTKICNQKKMDEQKAAEEGLADF